MITRSTKIKLNYANRSKLHTLMGLLSDNLTQEVSRLSNDFLYLDKIPTLPPKEITESIDHPSSWVRQIVAKEASNNARSIKNKLKKINKDGNLQKYQKELLEKYNSKDLTITWAGNLQLDSRFISIEKSTNSSFDYWIKVSWKGNKVIIPIKKTGHQKKLEKRGYSLKTNTLKLCRDKSIILVYHKEPEENLHSKEIGIDIGRNKSFICSDGNTEEITKPILNSLKAKKHGSKNKASHVRKLKQTIDYLVKSNIDWNISRLVLENLTGMKTGNRWGNINHHWSHSYIQTRIMMRAEELNVLVSKVYPAYTSQDCSSCGHRHKGNRSGELFQCLSCGYETDADFNASINILKRGPNNAHGQRSKS